MSTNEIKALKKKKDRKNENKIGELVELAKYVKRQEDYQQLLLLRNTIELSLALDDPSALIQISSKYIPFRELVRERIRLFEKEHLLAKVRFEGKINEDFIPSNYVYLLRHLYGTIKLESFLKEEDILPLSPFLSEEEFMKKTFKGNCHSSASEIFTDKKLMEIIGKIEEKATVLSADSVDEMLYFITFLFSVDERIKYFSPRVNFNIDTDTFWRVPNNREGILNHLSYQVCLEIPSTSVLWQVRDIKGYVKFLEGKIDPDLYVELYLTYCQ